MGCRDSVLLIVLILVLIASLRNFVPDIYSGFMLFLWAITSGLIWGKIIEFLQKKYFN